MGLSPTVSKMGNPLGEDYDVLLKQNDLENMSALRKTECMLQVIMGLQNDILGKLQRESSFLCINQQ
jgi:hypothetical protein